MSLTNDQKKDLKELGKKFREIEKTTMEGNIDLDVFMTGYGDDGIQLYGTEKISQKANAGKRKNVFERHTGEQKKQALKHH